MDLPIEVVTKSTDNTFSQKMEDYVMTLLNFYKKDIGKGYDFHKNIWTQLNKEWKCNLSVLLMEDILPQKETLYGTRSHSFVLHFKYNAKTYKLVIFLYNYSEENTNNEITVKSTSGLEHDELSLLKQLVFLTETQTDKVHFLIGLLGKCYSTYDVLIINESPTWVTTMPKRAILKYKDKFYYFAFGKSTVTAITVNSIIFRIH